MRISQLHEYCNGFLESGTITDYCPNGLQVEVHAEVGKLVSAVTASLETIEMAAAADAGTLLVHHGYFWKGEALPLVGAKGRRIKALFENKINLLAYHLPLDVNREVGNNRQLGIRLGWQEAHPITDDNLIWGIELEQAMPLGEIAEWVEDKLARTPLVIDANDSPAKRIAWCTGAAQQYIEVAAEQGYDIFISGEISEMTMHMAKELSINFISAGHHATERYGVKALGAHLAEKFNLKHQFIDVDNPV